MDGAGYAYIYEDFAQLTQPIKVALPDRNRVFDGLFLKPLSFLFRPFVLFGEEEERPAIDAFFDMGEILGFTLRTCLIPAHSL